jgi:hypothetical protein
MTHFPTTRFAPRLVTSSICGYGNVKSASDWLRVAMTNPDLLAVVAFCALGMLVTFSVMLRLPEFGMSVDHYL